MSENQPEHISQEGLSIIKEFEGLHQVRADGQIEGYICPAGKPTIGWGHTKTAYIGKVISREDAEVLLREDVDEFETGIRKLVKVPLSQNQFDALVSWAFNVGLGNAGSSTLIRRLNKGDYDAVPAQLTRWNKARVKGKLTVMRGLTRRRAAEADLWSMDEPLGNSSIDPVMPQDVGVQDKPITRDITLIGGGLAAITAVVPEALNHVTGLIPTIAAWDLTGSTQTMVILGLIGMIIYDKVSERRA